MINIFPFIWEAIVDLVGSLIYVIAVVVEKVHNNNY